MDKLNTSTYWVNMAKHWLVSGGTTSMKDKVDRSIYFPKKSVIEIARDPYP
jgi:hypothetical protein